MIGNVIDHRNERTCPEVDVVYEPSAHDNANYEDGSPVFEIAEVEQSPVGFWVTADYDVTVNHAVQRAQRDWPFAVTIYLYDKGSRPLG